MPTDEKPWAEGRVKNGVGEVRVNEWNGFFDFIHSDMVDYGTYIYRGQRKLRWKLEPSLDRIAREKGKLKSKAFRKDHLERFKLAVRGRRGSSPREIIDENDWWALGQHYGLSTPLLDWTESPFVAVYFSLLQEAQDDEERVVYALDREAIDNKIKEMVKKDELEKDVFFNIISPLSDDNARLVNQRGVFTRTPNGVDVEKWVTGVFDGESTDYVLIKIIYPITDPSRIQFLKALDMMNINHLTLFPDLVGASQYCNARFELW